MRLYTKCPFCKHRTYLAGIVARNRMDFTICIKSFDFDMQCPSCKKDKSYTVNDVCAESAGTIVPAMALLGMIFGMIFGSLFVLVCGLVGVVFGTYWDIHEVERITNFNTGIVTARKPNALDMENFKVV